MEQNKSFYLRVAKVSPAVEAANGNGSYKKVELRQYVSSQKSKDKWVNSPTAKAVTMNMWTAQKRSDGTITKPHFLYDIIEEGMELEGVIETLNTTAYTIETNGIKREARSITVAVFEGEDAIRNANAQLSNRDACVVTIDEDGVAQNTLNLSDLRERNAARMSGNTSGNDLKKNEELQKTPEELEAEKLAAEKVEP